MIALVAPSGPLAADRIARGIARLEADWGFTVRPGAHLHDHHRQLEYLAGDDADRAADFEAAWTDPRVEAVWCARGGYGAQRMIDRLDFDALRTAGPKQLIGFSDITALHARIGRELDQITLHAPVGTGDQLTDEPSAAALHRLLRGHSGVGDQLITGTALVPGRARGRLIGGNLALIAGDIGIEPAPDEPSIVIMEDVGESGYRIDRLLTQLRRSGWFTSVTGVVLGDFTESSSAELVDAVLLDRLGDLGVPVLHRAPFGHGTRNLALPLGAAVELDADAGSLRLL